MKIIASLCAVVILVIGLFLGFIYSGIYNVAATKPHTEFVYWVLDTVKRHSIYRHAREIAVPDWLSDPAVVQTGFRHYQASCLICHGAPGIDPSEISHGLYPPAPELTPEYDRWISGELFWIVKYGIKMTGMPAWGHAYQDEDLWAIVAFLHELYGGLTPDEYQAMGRGFLESKLGDGA